MKRTCKKPDTQANNHSAGLSPAVGVAFNCARKNEPSLLKGLNPAVGAAFNCELDISC
jgi:hypothetical protein